MRRLKVNFLNFPRQIFRSILLLLIGAYRTLGTTHLGGSCRFQPSCSEYALEAARSHPPYRAAKLIAVRLSRCRPGGPWGFDPVPPVKTVPLSGTFSGTFKEIR